MLIVLLSALFIPFVWTEDLKSISITNVDREVDVLTQIVRETLKYEIENAESSAINYFIQAIDKHYAQHIAIIQSSFLDSKKTVTQLEIVNVPSASKDYVYYKVTLSEPLPAGKKYKFTITISYTKLLVPFPTHISQKEQQFVKYEGNQYVSSAYHLKKQTTVFKLSSGTIEGYTKGPLVKQDGSTLTYGPFENINAYSNLAISIHYENNSPFLTVNQLTRLIEVSHWGNIAVEEVLNVSHTGAILKGSFSRFEFQRDPRSSDKQPCVKSVKTFLPASVKDVYYRDEIGNISTSNLRQRNDVSELELRPRFPLFGGWKTHYLIGYNVPSYEYLYNAGNKFVLKMRFIDHIFKNYVVDEALVKIILPEGAKDIEFITPYPVKRLPNEVHYTYLDTTGRPVVVALKKNLIEEHIKEFEIHYTFDRFNMIYEPLLIVAAFLFLFLLVIIYVRLDFTISKDNNEKPLAVEQKPESTPAAKKSAKKQQ